MKWRAPIGRAQPTLKWVQIENKKLLAINFLGQLVKSHLLLIGSSFVYFLIFSNSRLALENMLAGNTIFFFFEFINK